MAFLRVWSVQDVIWDDNAWLLTLYESNNLGDFLEAGPLELRRPQLGTYLYGLFWFFRNTEYFYLVWHGINTLTALSSPLLLYLFLRRSFPDRHELAFFSAIAFIIFHLDLTVLFASASNYRIGLLLTLLSFLFLERTIHEPKGIAGGWLFASICAAIVSHSIFMEATITLEPARWLVIFHLLRSRHAKNSQPWRTATYLWLLFVLAAMPVIIYKLAYKPFGLFGHVYHINPLFFLEWRNLLTSLAHYLLFYWVVLLQHIDAVTSTAWILGLISAVVSYFFLFKLHGAPHFADARRNLLPDTTYGKLPINNMSARVFLLLGVTAFVPSFLFFQLISRPPTSWDFDSSHAAIPQFGYAIIVGWLLAMAYRFSVTRNRRDPWMKYLFVALIGAGIFFSNANIDQYLHAWKAQSRFWAAFTNRFPTIPENAYFIFDIPKSTLYADLGNMYDLEFQLNLLYAKSEKPSRFRLFRAEALKEWYNAIGKTPRPQTSTDPDRIEFVIDRETFLGQEMVRTKLSNMIFVYFWNNKLLVNSEIVEYYPSILYKDWADMSIPSLPPGPVVYPLRHKLDNLR